MARIDLTPVSQPPVAGSSSIGLPGVARPAPGELKPGESFGNLLSNLLSTTNDLQVRAGEQSQALLSGETKNIHETMIAMEKANISFRFLSQVRNKALEAYREIQRMQM